MTRQTRIGEGERHHLERGGVPDQDTGRLAQPVRTHGLVRPDRVKADPERRCLWYDSNWLVEGGIPAELLDQFVPLSDASGKKIVQFAKKYGVLLLQRSMDLEVHKETFRAWRQWARRARATLSVAASLNRDALVDQADWDVLRGWWVDEWDRLPAERDKTSLLLIQSRWLEDVIGRWFDEAGVRPFYSHQQREIGFTNMSGVDEGKLTTLGVIALQLATAASREKFLAICSSCKVPYSAKRRPAIGRRNYCSQCGHRAACRDAQADKRAGLSKPRKKLRRASRKGRAKR